MIRTVTAELVDNCQLKCELCWNRNRIPSGKQMSLETVSKVLSKYGNRRIDWFNWGEPLLYKQFVDVANLVKGTHSRISTNLSLLINAEIVEAMQSFRSVLVSLSGMTADVYSIYHHGGNFDLVMSNLRKLKFSNIGIRWLEHKKNEHQKEVCQEFCKENGFSFSSQSLNCEVEDLALDFKHDLLKTTKSSYSSCRMLGSIVIGVDGQYLLCCASHNIPIGYTIDDEMTIEQLVKTKSNIPLCRVCQEKQLWKMF